MDGERDDMDAARRGREGGTRGLGAKCAGVVMAGGAHHDMDCPRCPWNPTSDWQFQQVRVDTVHTDVCRVRRDA